MPRKRLGQLGAGIAAIGEDVAQPGKAEADRLDHGGSAVPVLNIGGMDQHEKQEAERVGNDVALAALDLLSLSKDCPRHSLKSRRFRWS